MDREQVRDELAKSLSIAVCEVPDTIDGLAKLWDEHAKGWTWFRKHRGDGMVIWIAEIGTSGYGSQMRSVPDTGDERHDRMALLLAVLKRKGTP